MKNDPTFYSNTAVGAKPSSPSLSPLMFSAAALSTFGGASTGGEASEPCSATDGEFTRARLVARGDSGAASIGVNGVIGLSSDGRRICCIGASLMESDGRRTLDMSLCARGPRPGVCVGAATAAVAAAAAAVSASAPPASSLRVLVVDDQQVNRRLASAILTRRGHQCELAVNGEEALQVIRAAAEPFDLILMDLSMPVMDGLESTRRIRRGDCGAIAARTMISAMTACALDSDRGACLAAGMDTFLVKPIERDALHAVLDTALSRKKAQTLLVSAGQSRSPPVPE